MHHRQQLGPGRGNASRWHGPAPAPTISSMTSNTTGQPAEVHDRQIRDMFENYEARGARFAALARGVA